MLANSARRSRRGHRARDRISRYSWSTCCRYWILQPSIDAAFKKRGIDPEAFLAQRRLAGVPVPRPQRHAVRPTARRRRRPPVAGRHPGSSRGRQCRAGITVFVYPGGRRVAAAGQPAALRGHGSGPFGAPGLPPRRPTSLTSPPNPNGLPPAPGIPIAGRPGVPPRMCRARRCRCRRDAPPERRTENLQPRRVPAPRNRDVRRRRCRRHRPRLAGTRRQLPAAVHQCSGVAGGSGAQGGSQN